MSPWKIPPVSLFRSGCSGGADKHLDFIVSSAVPAVNRLPFSSSRSVIAGYSLAGLFAVYSLCRTDTFSEAVCASGSLWYPGFTEYVRNRGFCRRPDYVYFSLGDREAHTKNQYMKNVRICTREIFEYCSALGISTEYVTEKGNHFNDADGRLARGIACAVMRGSK